MASADSAYAWGCVGHFADADIGLRSAGSQKSHASLRALQAGFTEAWLYFTTAGGAFKGRKWQFIQCDLGKGELVSRKPLPKNATAFLVYGFRVGQGGHRSNHSASELVELKP